MEVTITESKLSKIIHKYINMSFEGFDNCYYDWAEFDCGMGVCCDPYAVGFVLPDSEYNDYINSQLIIYEKQLEKLSSLLEQNDILALEKKDDPSLLKEIKMDQKDIYTEIRKIEKELNKIN